MTGYTGVPASSTTGEALENGTGAYHSMGAFAGFIGANILAVVLGRMRRRVGFSPEIGRALVTTGVVGLLSTTVYLLMIISSAGDSAIGVIGLIERGATHPFLIGLLCAGASIRSRRTLGMLDAHPTAELRAS